MQVSKFTGGARRLGRAVLELPGTWRGSLQLRVVSLTLLLSVVIALSLGWVLNAEIRDGLVEAKESSSLAMVSSGFGEAANYITAAGDRVRNQTAATQQGAAGSRSGDAAESAAWFSELVGMVNNLCSGASTDTY